MLQIELGGFFVNVQPDPSWPYDEKPWPQVLSAPGVDKVVFDQCQIGLRDRHGGILRKTTGLTSNAPDILNKFVDLRCPGRRTHMYTSRAQ